MRNIKATFCKTLLVLIAALLSLFSLAGIGDAMLSSGLQDQSKVSDLSIAKTPHQQYITAATIISADTTRGRNMIPLVAGVIFINCAILVYLFYNRHKLKQATIWQAEVIRQQDLAAKGIIEAEERERKRVATDLHDGLGQLFSAVRLNLGSLVDRTVMARPEDTLLAERTLALVDESCREVRTIANQMTPDTLVKTGLANALWDLVYKIDTDKLTVTLEISGLRGRLDNNIEMILYRVIQECVTNVLKHAHATRLDIQLDKSDTEISVTIEDNGVGFDINDHRNFDGIGLKNIFTRSEYLKGSAEFSSAPGKGTLVAIYVPLTTLS